MENIILNILKKANRVPIVLFMQLLLFTTTVNCALAWHSSSYSYGGSSRVSSMPRSSTITTRGGDAYSFYGGRYYSYRSGGYFLSTPPFGLFISTLPLGFVTLTIGGIPYYELNGIYYQQAQGGYVVVQQPTTVVAPSSNNSNVSDIQNLDMGSVVVKIDLLNLRNGPSQELDVINQVKKGTVLKVIGRSTGWYYVEQPSGERGWVMDKFVTPLKPIAEG